jgi:hypothetical protein
MHGSGSISRLDHHIIRLKADSYIAIIGPVASISSCFKKTRNILECKPIIISTASINLTACANLETICC